MKELYSITNNATEILAGTSNTIMKAYTEAANITRADDVSKSVRNLQKFAKSIQKVIGTKDSLDPTIAQTKGRITAIKDYRTIQESLNLITKQIPDSKAVSGLNKIHQHLINTVADYSDGYKYNVKLVKLEYETLTVLLIQGITMIITSNINVETKQGKTKITVTNPKNIGGVLSRSINDAVKQLTPDHTKYLKDLIKLESSDRAVTEAVADTLNAANSILGSLIGIFGYGRKIVSNVSRSVKTIVRTAFGIIPLMRTMVYYYYKGKVNTMEALEQQAAYIEMNMELLKNQKTGDPKKKEEIIKKQEAYVKAYRKKAEKIRVQLLEGEKQAADALANDKTVTESDDDGDLVLD